MGKIIPQTPPPCGSLSGLEGAPPWYIAKSSAAVGLQPASRLDFSENLPSKIDRDTGEVLEVHRSSYDPASTRLERFALQAGVRRILPKSRTAKCLRVRQAHRSEIDVFRSLEYSSAHYGGLQTCGSVWACPVVLPRFPSVDLSNSGPSLLPMDPLAAPSYS